MQIVRRFAIAVTMALALAAPALAQGEGKPELHVEHAFARAAPRTGGAFLTITNTGKAADRLVSASAPVAAQSSVHESKMENGVMTMRPLGPLTIAPGKRVVLKPGGDHIMLMGLKKPLKPGDSFPLTLTFEKSGAITVMVPVEKAGAMAGMKME